MNLPPKLTKSSQEVVKVMRFDDPERTEGLCDVLGPGAQIAGFMREHSGEDVRHPVGFPSGVHKAREALGRA